MKWILVKDELPEFKEKVLIALGNYISTGLYYKKHPEEIKGDWLDLNDSGCCGCRDEEVEPTHWMPLPEAPKEDK